MPIPRDQKQRRKTPPGFYIQQPKRDKIEESRHARIYQICQPSPVSPHDSLQIGKIRKTLAYHLRNLYIIAIPALVTHNTTSQPSLEGNSPRENARLIANLASPPIILALRPLDNCDNVALFEPQVPGLVGLKCE